MLISAAIARAREAVAARERDVLQAYTPGARPERSDAAAPANADFTLDPLSASAPPDTYFASSSERGNTSFSRDGRFAISSDTLVDGHGRPVLGYHDGSDALAPLRVNAVDAALGYANGARIERDGSVTYERATIDPRTGNRETQRISIGRVALARFAPGTPLQAIDAARFTAPAGAAPHFGRATDGNFAALTPNSREGSRVDIDLGLQKMQEAYLSLDALQAADRAGRDLEKTAMDLLK
ncbi:MAG: hypothetical protein M3R35_07380 [Candidatus Eremiobacteraeota bacterium]|nr:hypothetical protein [Candidatus Eremiobacteraeota bacterium]